MLNQFINTRSLVHRDLLNNGKVFKKDGYEIFSMNKEIFNAPIPNYDLVKDIYTKYNCASEKSNNKQGLFGSYDFISLTPDYYLFTFDYVYSIVNQQRNKGIIRIDPHAKQCLLGNIEDYPYKWFQTSVFDIIKEKTASYWYLNDDEKAEPEWLKPVSTKPQNSIITVEKIKAFVNDQRQQVVKAAIWFIIQEMSKEENERKVLLIEDVPGNVELWIAAIELGFSASLARTISFSTNITNLNGNINAVLFYSTDESGKYSKYRENLTRHPFFMIAGFHPLDKASKVNQMPASNFVIIDGTNKTCGIQTDSTINDPYYEAAIKYEDDITDFTNIVLPSLSLNKINKNIVKLYDAYKYILDANHKANKWEYKKTIVHLEQLLSYGPLKSNHLVSYIYKEGIQAYQMFIREDISNNFKLFNMLFNLGKQINNTSELLGCITDELIKKIQNPHDSSLPSFWDTIKQNRIHTYLKESLQDLFNDHELESYTQVLKEASPKTIKTLLDIYFYVLSLDKGGKKSIINNKFRRSFVCKAIFSLIDDRDSLIKVLKEIENPSEVFNTITIIISNNLHNKFQTEYEKFWNSIIELKNGNIFDLCKEMIQSPNANMDTIEYLLVKVVVKSRKCDPQVIQIFKEALKKLDKNENTGNKLFTSWIEVENVENYSNIVRCITSLQLSKDVQIELFEKIDQKIPCTTNKKIIQNILSDVKSWGDRIGRKSTIKSLEELAVIIEEEDSRDILEQINQIVENKIRLINDFTSSDLYKKLIQVLVEVNNDKVYLSFIHMFKFTNEKEKKNFIHSYISSILANSKKQLVNVLVTVCKSFCYKTTIANEAETIVQQTRLMMRDIFNELLKDYYKSSLVEQIENIHDLDSRIKDYLNKQFEEIEESKPKKGLSSLFGDKKTIGLDNIIDIFKNITKK